MRTHRTIGRLCLRLIALVTVGLIPGMLAGCGQQGPAAPSTGPGIMGRVKVTARISNPQAQVTETRTLADVDGVLVHLTKPDGTLDSTLTRDGVYEFRLSVPGTYRVKVWISPEDTVSSGDLTFSGSGTVTANDLELATTGDLVTYPNPFPTAEGLSIELTQDSEQTYEVVILTLAAMPVWSYSLLAPAGLQHVHWMGTDSANQVLPNGTYWVRARFNGGDHYNLVFKH